MFIHHSKEPQDAMGIPDIISSARGNTAITGKMDIIMHLTGSQPENKTLNYSGRTRVDTKDIKLWQDINTGLLHHGSSKRKDEIAAVLAHNPQCKNVSQLVKLCKVAGMQHSESTLTRDIKEMEITFT